MHFGYTGDQEQCRDIVARFLRERSPMTAVRAQMASERGHDPALWRGLAEELGLTGVHVPDSAARFFLNGKFVGEIRDAEFARLFFGIWLSPRTSEPKLRNALLAGG